MKQPSPDGKTGRRGPHRGSGHGYMRASFAPPGIVSEAVRAARTYKWAVSPHYDISGIKAPALIEGARSEVQPRVFGSALDFPTVNRSTSRNAHDRIANGSAIRDQQEVSLLALGSLVPGPLEGPCPHAARGGPGGPRLHLAWKEHPR